MKIIYSFIFLILFGRIASAQMVLEYNLPNTHRSISIPLAGTVNVTVDWGDGSPLETFMTKGNKYHYYTSAGIKTVTIRGSLTAYGSTEDGNGNRMLTKVLSWDGLGLKSFSYAFYQAYNLSQVPTSLPSTVTDMSAMFFMQKVLTNPLILGILPL